MTTNDIELALVVNNQPMREFAHEGRCYIESREGTSYGIRIKNNKGHRVKVVISLDGLSILTGKPVSDNPDETGYILGAYTQETFKGWRLDDDQVAAFTFLKRENSYATETGEGQGNGVIALRVYAEKENEAEKKLKELEKQFEEFKRNQQKEYIPYPVYPSYPWWYDRWDYPYRPYPYIHCGGTSTVGYGISATTANSAGQGGITLTAMNCADTKSCLWELTSQSVSLNAATVEPQAFDHGSGWGELKKEVVTHTTFETGSLIAELVIFYASLEGLKILGVNVSREKTVAFPEPFKRQYATPPKGWISGKV